MIKINLAGTARKKVAKAGVAKAAGPSNLLPIAEVGLLVAAAAGGYLWYANLSGQAETLRTQIAQANAQKAQLDAVIKQDQIYEARKKSLESRIKIIEDLQRNQVSPVLSLDVLGQAIDRTQYVWLSSLSQNNTVFTMAGTGTSLNALADFVENLEATGYFRNIDLRNATQDASGNTSFNMTCEFSRWSSPVESPDAILAPAPTGDN